MYNKIHGCDMIIVNDDTVKRLEFGLCLFDDLNFGESLEFHILKQEGLKGNTSSFLFLLSYICELCYFFFGQHYFRRSKIFLDVLWIERHGNRDDAWL